MNATFYHGSEKICINETICDIERDTIMIVKFFAFFRDPEFAGCKEMQWPEEASSVYELCHQIADRFGPKFRNELLTPDGEAISDRSFVLVNGRRIEFLNGIQTPLKSSDTVYVFPVVAGG